MSVYMRPNIAVPNALYKYSPTAQCRCRAAVHNVGINTPGFCLLKEQFQDWPVPPVSAVVHAKALPCVGHPGSLLLLAAADVHKLHACRSCATSGTGS